MKSVIVRKIHRPDANLVQKLGEFGVATIYEAQGRTGLMHSCIRPIYPSAHLAGSAVTALCHSGDNLMIHAAIEMCSPGDVMIVATKSESTHGMFGELLATSFKAHGISGLVIDAGVRDVSELIAMQFPVFAKVITSQGTVKETAGSVNVGVICAGALVKPGDAVIADIDGVVVVPRGDVADVVRRCEERRKKEAKNREALSAGTLGLDLYGLREKIKALGVEYVDREPE